MKKIDIKDHTFKRISQRLPKFNSKGEFEKFINSRRRLIAFNKPIGKPYKVNMNYNTMPITVVVFKTNQKINILTVYINEKTKKGKFIKKKVEHEKQLSRHNQTDK